MCSGAGSKGAFVVDDSGRKRLVKLRREHGHVLSSEANDMNPINKVCEDRARETSHNSHKVKPSPTKKKNTK